MGKYLKGSDGKFSGSVGEGIDAPTTMSLESVASDLVEDSDRVSLNELDLALPQVKDDLRSQLDSQEEGDYLDFVRTSFGDAESTRQQEYIDDLADMLAENEVSVTRVRQVSELANANGRCASAALHREYRRRIDILEADHNITTLGEFEKAPVEGLDPTEVIPASMPALLYNAIYGSNS